MSISNTGVISWTPDMAQIGEHQIVVRASNAEGYDEVSYIIQVNGPLQITSQPAQVAYDSHPYVYVVTTSVPAQRYILSVAPEGMTINTSGQINWTPDSGDMGTHNVLIRAEDSLGNWASQSFVLSVLGNNASTNQPPQFLSTPSTRTVADQLYYYQAQAVDPNGLAVTYSLTTGPAGMTLSSTGDLHWTPTLAQVGAHPVSIEASDGMTRTTQSYSLLVASTSAPNSPPQLTGSPIQHFETGKLTTDQVSVTDADGDSLTYVLTASPAGMVIDGSGKISWQPTLQQLGQHSVALRVEDGFGGIATRSYSVNVTEPVIQNASFLSLINEPKTEAFVGTNYRFRTAGFSTRGGSVAVALVNVPSGMTIRANTPMAGYYELNWTPDEANCQRDVTLELRDSLGNTRQITYTIDVYNAPKRLGRFQCSADAEFCATR